MEYHPIRVVTDVPGVWALEAEWEALYEQQEAHATVCQSWAWMASWLAAFGEEIEALAIFVAEGEQGLRGLLPLAFYTPAEGDAGERVARFIGAWHSDYHDWLVEPALTRPLLETALVILREMGATRVRFTEIPPWSSLPATLAAVAERRSLALASGPSETCPIVGLPASWEEYLASRTPKMRKNILYTQRTLSRHAYAFSICDSPADLPTYQRHFFDLHDRWWQSKSEQGSDPSALTDPRTRRFLTEAMTRLFARGRLCLSLQQDGDAVLSAFVTFSQRRSLAYYLSGINPDYARCSPGVAHIARLIAHAIEQGYREFDFLRGTEPYKFRWNTGVYETRWYEVRL